jgi:hypothetical protein
MLLDGVRSDDFQDVSNRGIQRVEKCKFCCIKSKMQRLHACRKLTSHCPLLHYPDDVRFRGWSQLIDATLYLNRKDGVFKMSYRSRIYFTSKQKSEILDRWQRGESMSFIRRLFDRDSSSRSQTLKAGVNTVGA